MGLDITAYRGLRALRTLEPYDDNYDHDDVSFYVNPDFAGRADGVDCSQAYEAEEAHRFRAGSYGGYNRWREWLASLVDTTPQRVWAGEKPAAFGELILFSDCEGTIGPVVAARLAQDFAAYETKAAESGDEWFMQVYRDFKLAFEMATDRGAVSFH